MNILQDFKERFLNFETLKGVYLLPAGGVICYVTLFYLQYVIQAFCLALGIYMMVEGFRKIQVNRVKQSLAAERLKDARLREMDWIRNTNGIVVPLPRPPASTLFVTRALSELARHGDALPKTSALGHAILHLKRGALLWPAVPFIVHPCR